MSLPSILDEEFSIDLPCIKVAQPLGVFYVTAMSASVLRQITLSDVREMKDREMDTYLGIQRQVNSKRVNEIGEYVSTIDACFPTAVILAVEGRCAEYNDDTKRLTLRTPRDVGESNVKINKIQIARVLDGQHRIEGLQYLSAGVEFDINVSVFIDMDIENQAYLFSVVNLAQTKVNRSLAYDLFEYARSLSPQKSAHNIAVALNRAEASPFYQRIKRLGVATKGVFTETLTQATVVESLIPYLSDNAIKDRQQFLKGNRPKHIEAEQLRVRIFRNMFLDNRELDIAEILFNYFSAVRDHWPTAWSASGDGSMLSKTNGFRAFMRLLRPAYLYFTSPGKIVGKEQFLSLFTRSSLNDQDFNTDNFKPGSSGELALYRKLLEDLRIS